MKLVKIEDGLLEQDNFYSVSPFSHFIGNFNGRRENGKFELHSGFIERQFNYDQYVIVVEKENPPLQPNDKLYMYVREDGNRAGIIESIDLGINSYSYWKLLRYDGFTQGYVSQDGIDWIHTGGGDTPTTSIQGFQIEGSTGFDIVDYKVYKSPYVTLYGFPKDTLCTIEDNLGNTISTAIFDSDGKAELLIEHMFLGRFKAIDTTTSTLLLESDYIDLKFGDTYSYTEYDLQVIYKGEVLTYYPTLLTSRREKVILKNVSTIPYENIHLRAVIPNTDTITISLDNVNFNDAVILPLINPQEEIDLYIQIEKDRTVLSYGTRHFTLEID